MIEENQETSKSMNGEATIDSWQSKAVIFFHIPKTAGTTMRFILQRQYDPAVVYRLDPERWRQSIDDFSELPTSERYKYRLLLGHMSFGIHELLPQPYAYFTMLRDPIDRIISIYHYLLRYTSHYLHDTVVSQKMKLSDVVCSGLSREFDNWQTRALAGKIKEVPFGECTTDMLETAKWNLRDYFPVVGTTERFDETLVLLKNTFGWQQPFYRKQNVTRNRPKKKELSQESARIIAERNALDIQLHRFAEEMLDESIRAKGPSFDKDLNSFKMQNKVYTVSYPVMHKIGRARDKLLSRR